MSSGRHLFPYGEGPSRHPHMLSLSPHYPTDTAPWIPPSLHLDLCPYVFTPERSFGPLCPKQHPQPAHAFITPQHYITRGYLFTVCLSQQISAPCEQGLDYFAHGYGPVPRTVPGTQGGTQSIGDEWRQNTNESTRLLMLPKMTIIMLPFLLASTAYPKISKKE